MNSNSNVENNSQVKLAGLKAQLKELKQAKAEIARQFKQVTKGTLEHQTLLKSMQENTAQLNTVTQSLKQLELLENAPQEPANTQQSIAIPSLYSIEETSQWNQPFSLVELEQSQFNLWYQFCADQKNSSGYHQPAWAQLIASVFRHPTRIFVAMNSKGNIIGGIPLVFFNSKLFGKFAVSIPYVNYGGFISAYFDITKALMQHLQSVCIAEELKYIDIRTMQPGLDDKVSNKKASMILRLPLSSEALDIQLGSKVRAQIKKAEVHNPTVKFGTQELLADFYSVFAMNMRDLGTPVYSKRWFESILNQHDIRATLCVVYINNKPVSAGFLVGHNAMLEIPWASTLKRANVLNANMWMYRKILDFAIAQDYGYFDFGRSTQDAGTYKFKKQWGAIPYIHYWYKITPDNSAVTSELNPDNPKFKFIIRCWQLLPVWLTKIIGPFIVRDIP